jgi:hypothetical protein
MPRNNANATVERYGHRIRILAETPTGEMPTFSHCQGSRVKPASRFSFTVHTQERERDETVSYAVDMSEEAAVAFAEFVTRQVGLRKARELAVEYHQNDQPAPPASILMFPGSADQEEAFRSHLRDLQRDAAAN